MTSKMKIVKEFKISGTQHLVILEPDVAEPRYTVAVVDHSSHKTVLSHHDYCQTAEEAEMVFLKRTMFNGLGAFQTKT